MVSFSMRIRFFFRITLMGTSERHFGIFRDGTKGVPFTDLSLLTSFFFFFFFFLYCLMCLIINLKIWPQDLLTQAETTVQVFSDK